MLLYIAFNAGYKSILPPFYCKSGKQISNLDKQNCFYCSSIYDMKTLFYFPFPYFHLYFCFVYLESVRYIYLYVYNQVYLCLCTFIV